MKHLAHIPRTRWIKPTRVDRGWAIHGTIGVHTLWQCSYRALAHERNICPARARNATISVLRRLHHCTNYANYALPGRLKCFGLATRSVQAIAQLVTSSKLGTYQLATKLSRQKRPDFIFSFEPCVLSHHTTGWFVQRVWRYYNNQRCFMIEVSFLSAVTTEWNYRVVVARSIVWILLNCALKSTHHSMLDV